MLQFPTRPGIGGSGRPIQVRSNFFPILTLPNQNVHQYEVTIYPDVPPAKNRRVIRLWEEASIIAGTLNGVRPIYDGRKHMFTSRPIPMESDSVVYYLDYYEDEDWKSPSLTGTGSPTKPRSPVSPQPVPTLSTTDNTSTDLVDGRKSSKKFKLTIAKIGEINMSRLSLFLDGRLSETPLDAIGALDILLRHRPSLMYTTVGRCFYTSDSAAMIANGAQLWQGFHQSLRPARGQMLINLDVSATAFYQTGPVVEIVAKILGKQSAGELRSILSDKDRQKLEKTLKGLKVVVTHRGQVRRKYRIAKLTSTPANRTMFVVGQDAATGATGTEESVASYFQAKYNRHLYFPHLPCLVVGDPSKHVYLPLEVCEIIPGQRHLRKLNERQTAEMIKFTCQPPHVRSNKISAGITILQQRDNDYLKDFGVQIGHEMAIVNARVLPAPSISYHPASKEPVITPREGAWNLRDKMVAQGVIIRSWSVVAFGSEADYPVGAVQKFVTLLVQTCEECGVFIQNRQPPISYANPQGNVEKTLIDAYMVAGNSFQERPQLIVCVLPNTGVPLYAEIKRVSDTVIGIATQCIQAKHMFAAKRQYCANVCLKINVKLGGMNSYLSNTQLPFISERPTIVFGADVTHPAPGSSSTQSIAALVGSMDAQCSRYAAAIRVQKGRQDSIQDLTGMVIELLKTFYQTCGAKPDRILFYRDGVSEGQFGEVLRNEVEAIQRACSVLDPNYRPTITYVIVQKRHHARFFPIRKEDSDKSGNVLPGTIIETGVTHPSEFDFYLCSHPGLQGTSKPTHYHVLYDENRFFPDALQELTYRLCYLYCRATRSVSVCPPAYYAHLVAARARFHATGEGWSESASVSEAGSVYSMTGAIASPIGPGGATSANDVTMKLRKKMSTMSLNSVASSGMSSFGERVMNYGTVKPELTKVMYFM
ncbi:Piwi domain-containing protein [Polychytrium aggregatum]|uniref:Piwi domain-containing protein n=1 Tax=Polychytrium aggregatum TaxID=110093 RepID=UPI0022FE0F12|nr:Piwi domain-containing protein [Polychytrium aggregatum]KAI9203830.1 Piwi domain-containing protein [Polychytrium aggregatum]